MQGRIVRRIDRLPRGWGCGADEVDCSGIDARDNGFTAGDVSVCSTDRASAAGFIPFGMGVCVDQRWYRGRDYDRDGQRLFEGYFHRVPSFSSVDFLFRSQRQADSDPNSS